MAIAKNPIRNTNASALQDPGKEREAVAFISGAGQGSAMQTPTPATEALTEAIPTEQNKKPVMVRIDPDILVRIDRAAKRLGISRSAFIVSSVAERLEKME